MARVNSEGIVGDFVNKYFTFIRPAIEGREIDGARIAIGDVVERFRYFENLQQPIRRERAYASYKLALAYLKGFVDYNRLGVKFLDLVDRQVNELDLVMEGDEDYEKHRQRKTEQLSE